MRMNEEELAALIRKTMHEHWHSTPGDSGSNPPTIYFLTGKVVEAIIAEEQERFENEICDLCFNEGKHVKDFGPGECPKCGRKEPYESDGRD